MVGLIKGITKIVAVAAPVVAAAFAVKKLNDVSSSQQDEVSNLIEESDANLETTMEIMAENNDAIIKEAMVGIDSRRRAQVKKAFEQITQSELYNTQLRFMNYNMWHNERIARNQAFSLLGVASLSYVVVITSILLFK